MKDKLYENIQFFSFLAGVGIKDIFMRIKGQKGKIDR